MTDQLSQPSVAELREEPGKLPEELTPVQSRLRGRRSTDRLLSLSEGRYQSLIRAMAAMVWTATPEGHQINEIPEWQAFTGQTREQAAGFGWADAIHPEDRELSVALWREAIATGRPLELEQRLRRWDGVYRIMQVRAVPVRDVSGAIAEWVGMHQDITEQRNLEAALRQREWELSEAHRIARLGAWSWDVPTNRISWSDVVYEIFARDKALPPPNFEELGRYHLEESWKRLTVAIRSAVDFGEPYELDVEIVDGEGQHKWIAARGEVEAFAGGKAVRLRGTIQDVSERKSRLFEAQAAEAAIRQSEERLRVASQCARFGTFDTDLVHGNQYWSPEMRTILGISWDAPTPGALKVPGFVHPDDVEKVSRNLQSAVGLFSDGEIFDEHRIVRPDGSVRWMQLRGRVQFEDEGGQRRPVRYSGTILDITDRKMAESAVRKSEERFRKLFESDLMGIGTPHFAGGFDEVNDELLRIVGYTRADFEAGLVRWDVMTPAEYTKSDLEHVQEAVRRGSCTPYEKEYIRKDGTRVPVLCGYASLETSPDQFIGFVQDLTGQKRAEAALRDREQRFSVLAESLPSLIFVTEQDGMCSYCNGRFLEYAGYAAEDMASIRWESLIHPEDLPETVEAWRHSTRTGEPFLKEHRLRRHDAVYRWFLSRAMPVCEPGKVARWFGSATEVHEQKLAEQALRRSDKLAAMGRLAASVAHEINNPLTSVTNALYLARIDPTLSETTREFLELADQELARVAQVATQTLRFYKQSTAPALCDVAQILEQVVTVYAARLRGLSVEVIREYDSDSRLHCFGDELRQVFANLIGNALDAMPDGGRLRVRVRRVGERGVRVLVADTGSGIPADVVHQIFEPFVSTKADTGTGLGLWVSDGIVRKHGGTITVRSCSGEHQHGTVFSVFLPIAGSEGSAGPLPIS